MRAENNLKINGFTLTEILVAIAVGAILSLIAATLVEYGSIQINFSNSRIAADSAFKTAVSVLANHSTCSASFAGALGPSPPNPAPIFLNLAGNTDIPQLYVRNNSIALSAGQNLDTGVALARLYFRLVPAPQAPGVMKRYDPATNTVISYPTYVGEVVMSFTTKSIVPIRDMTIPLTIAVDPVLPTPANPAVFYCYDNLSLGDLCVSLGGVMANGQCSFPKLKVDCSAAPAPACPALTACAYPLNFYYLNGFDAAFNPICKCQSVCDRGLIPVGGGGGKGGGN